jgi:hypothetical protein
MSHAGPVLGFACFREPHRSYAAAACGVIVPSIGLVPRRALWENAAHPTPRGDRALTQPTSATPINRPDDPDARAAAFIERWEASQGAERANYQLFLSELCDLIGVPRPEPARGDDRDNAYVFERAVRFDDGDGLHSPGWIDLYRRGCFVL